MKNILVVDDSALMRRVICDIINTDSSFQAKDVCRDGLEAYEKLKKTSYDAVILDVNMPKIGAVRKASGRTHQSNSYYGKYSDYQRGGGYHSCDGTGSRGFCGEAYQHY